MKHKLHKFNTNATREAFEESEKYAEPYVSLVSEDKGIHYNAVIDYTKRYFATVALESGTISFNIDEGISTEYITSISYSIDDGETWVTTENQNDKTSDLIITVSVSEGDKVLWKGDAEQISCSNGQILNSFFASTCEFDVVGNIMSLLYQDDYENKTTINNKRYCFYSLFASTKVKNAKDLVLPATTLAEKCYDSMFQGCTRLVTAPQLPATNLASACYLNMFGNCTSLTTAPTLLATSLTQNCYDGMFFNCTSLTTAPQLPAILLEDFCYHNMFFGCTSLTTAPELLATDLMPSCYSRMFQGCSNLNYIKAMFTTNPTEDPTVEYTDRWVSGVAASGTFVKNSEATWSVSGVDGIPNGWTVETASE